MHMFKKLAYDTNFFPDSVDPNRDGHVSLQEYMAFMISKETENVQSSEEIENAFRAITSGERPYVTKDELFAVSKPSAFWCSYQSRSFQNNRSLMVMMYYFFHI